jgi:hypothetical protein
MLRPHIARLIKALRKSIAIVIAITIAVPMVLETL